MINKSKTLNYLSTLPEDRQLVIVSFFATDSEAISRLESQWSQRDPAHSVYIGRSEEDTKKVTSADLGGSVCLIDPLNLSLGFLCEVECPVATGLYYRSYTETLYVGSNKWIRLIKGGRIINVVGNTLFNDIHSLSMTFEGNFLVASTGIDALLEVDFSDTTKIIWDWLATEHGYGKTPNNIVRNIDRSVNFQEIGTNTIQHTTHINSGFNYKKNKLLATLFHQGILIDIDKQTKEHRIVFEGMKSPHSIRKRTDGFVISDTRNNRVVLLDYNFKLERQIESDFNWVQDCIEVNDGLFLVADSNNSRLILINSASKIEGLYNIAKGTKKCLHCLL